MDDILPADPIQLNPKPSDPAQQPPAPSPSGPESLPPLENPFTKEENAKQTETLPTPEAPAAPAPQVIKEEKIVTLEDVVNEPPPETEKIVDKTAEVTAIHSIPETTDSLTVEADKKEEDFIEEVEKHHGHL